MTKQARITGNTFRLPASAPLMEPIQPTTRPPSVSRSRTGFRSRLQPTASRSRSQEAKRSSRRSKPAPSCSQAPDGNILQRRGHRPQSSRCPGFEASRDPRASTQKTMRTSRHLRPAPKKFTPFGRPSAISSESGAQLKRRYLRESQSPFPQRTLDGLQPPSAARRHRPDPGARGAAGYNDSDVTNYATTFDLGNPTSSTCSWTAASAQAHRRRRSRARHRARHGRRPEREAPGDEGPNTPQGIVDILSAIANDNKAQVVSDSWYSTHPDLLVDFASGGSATQGSLFQVENDLFMQMKAQGRPFSSPPETSAIPSMGRTSGFKTRPLNRWSRRLAAPPLSSATARLTRASPPGTTSTEPAPTAGPVAEELAPPGSSPLGRPARRIR